MKTADITLQNGKFLISGELDFANVMSVYNKSLKDLPKCHELHFDFSALTSSDSSGIALIIDWIKLARKCKMKIHLHHLPKDLMSIVKAAGMDGIILGAGV